MGCLTADLSVDAYVAASGFDLSAWQRRPNFGRCKRRLALVITSLTTGLPLDQLGSWEDVVVPGHD